MKFDVFETAGDLEGECLFALGWGNRPEHAPVGWLLDRLTEAGWRVHAATLPVRTTDVDRDWVRPIERYAAERTADADGGGEPPFDALLGHSAGGLTLALADVEAPTTTYLSPWWGYPSALEGGLAEFLASLPTDRALFAVPMVEPTILGEHGTQAQLDAVPDRISPAFVQATRGAQDRVDAIGPDSVVFCSLTDEVVSTHAIGERADSRQVVLYDGGHELFSSASRDEHLPTLLDALDGGLAAVR